MPNTSPTEAKNAVDSDLLTSLGALGVFSTRSGEVLGIFIRSISYAEVSIHTNRNFLVGRGGVVRGGAC